MAPPNHNCATFLADVKACGIQVTQEPQLLARLGEARNWQYAFSTLLHNGTPLGITFEPVGRKASKTKLSRVLNRFSFSPRLIDRCLACF